MATSRTYIISKMIIVAAICFFSSCNEDSFTSVVTIEIPEHEPQLVASAQMINGLDSQSIILSLSRSILDDRSVVISDAQVAIWYQGAEWAIFNSVNQSSLYVASTPLFIESESYELVVTHGTMMIKSQQVVPSMPIVDDFLFKKQAILTADGERVDELSFVIRDQPEIESYYQIEVFSIHSFQQGGAQDTIKIQGLMSLDPIITLNPETILSDQGFSSENYLVRLQFYPIGTFSQQKFNIRISGITKDYYFFLKALSQYQESNGNPFAEPVVLPTNFDNGFGFFSISNGVTFQIE